MSLPPASLPRTLPELFSRHWPTGTDAVLAEVPGGRTLTYAEAHRLSGRYANVLRDHGVAKRDRVAVQVEKSPEVLLLYLACLRAGAVFLPMNPAYTAEETRYLLGDAQPSLFVHQPHSEGAPAATLTLGADGTGTLPQHAASAGDHFDDVAVAPDDLAALLYTSGTTGRPKGAKLTHANLATNAATLHQAWGFRPDDRLLHALPLFHAHGLFVAAHCSLANGTAMTLLPRFGADAVVAALSGCTVFMGVPTHYVRLLEHPGFDAEACRNIRLFVSGSAPMPAATHAQVRERTGQVVLERYGMTETVMLTSNPLDGERRSGTVGLPLPGVEVRVAANEDIDGPAGAVEVRGPNVFTGYWGHPELAATEFTDDGWFRTGDLGTFDHDGYLTLVGRSKDLIITGGLNVYPKEVEAVLDAIPGVVESAVFGVPDSDFGERVAAVVVSDGSALAPAALRRAAREHLASFKVPKQVHIADGLPRNTMGKVSKAILREQFSP